MKRKILFIIFLGVFCIALIPLGVHTNTVFANELTDSVQGQLDNLDLKELENFYNNLDYKFDNNFINNIYSILNGENIFNYGSFINYLGNIFLSKISSILPTFLCVLTISIFCGIMQNFKSSFLSDSVADLIFLICFIVIVVMLSSGIVTIYNETKIAITNIAKLTEIMSPIILTLMVASGGVVSASVYKPAVVFLSSSVLTIFTSIVIPLLSLMFVFTVLSNFSTAIKLNKFIEFTSSILKWIIGLTVSIFSIFITAQGVVSACHDGISIRAAKYTIANTIPIVGGFVKDGFDLILAGSVLLKNAVGISSVFILFSVVLSPLILIVVYSLLLKLTAALTENIVDTRVSNFCTSVSKCINYLSAILVLAGFMLFFTIILMIISANVFL